MKTLALMLLIFTINYANSLPRTKDESLESALLDELSHEIDTDTDVSSQDRNRAFNIKRLIDIIQSDLDMSENTKEINYRGKERKSNVNAKGKGLGKMFDDPEALPPDSDLENILEGQIVLNGKHRRKPTGSKQGEKMKLVGDNMDEHMTIPKGPQKRNFVLTTSKYWTKGIVPYEIDTQSNYTVDELNKIYGAIQQFDNLTCVRWVNLSDPRNTVENLGHSAWVKIISQSGCTSYVGNVVYALKTPYQPLTLLRPGCMSVATAVHEMLHALGAQHEQSRSDRDNYIEILYQNMLNSSAGNFKLQSTTNFSPYNMESDLQYSLRSFSSNGGQTMRAKDWRLEFLANIADGLMYYDIYEVTQAYKCASSCPVLNCQNAGFVNWQCQCYCPNVLKGPLCTETVGNCGGVIDVPAGQAVYVTTPNYPNNYTAGLQCTWLVQGDPYNVLRMTIEDMDVSTNGLACYHFVEIRYNLLGQTGPKRCGKTTHEVWDATIDEFKNKMIIRFDSFISSDKPTSRGMKMKFESIGTGCVNNPCKFGECYSPINTATYTCTCDPGFTGTNCDVLSVFASVGCTVEVGEYCMLSHEQTTDIFNWDFGSGKTPTSYTGPSNAVEGFEYLFTESSAPRVTGDTAVLYTNLVFPSVDRCLRFKYHMYGSGMGTLNVYKVDEAGTKVKVFTKTGNQGNVWLDAAIFIPAMNGLQVRFESIRGAGSTSDMAIDDVWLIPGLCA